MFCPNCKREITNEADFCPNCGINIKLINNNKPKKKLKIMPIIIVLIVLLLIVVSVFLVIKFLDKGEKEFENSESNPPIEENPSEVKKEVSTLQLLKEDYDNGIIDVNKYFTELVNYEYDADSLDSKYKPETNYFSDGSNEILDILENHESELDQTIVKKYLENASLANVLLGDEEEVEVQTNSSNTYKVQHLDNNQKNIANHRLNRVHLSRNGNFLIWYTGVGTDAITDEQLNNISNGLEDAVFEYKQKFNVEYSYSPYVDNNYFNEDYKNAKKVLEQFDIPTSKLKTAMSVYVYDTGSDGTLGSYKDEHNTKKIINRSLILDILDEDGVMNYPYIVINQSGIENTDSLKQVYRHELFHHIQYTYCKSTSDKRCQAGSYSEGTANLASALLNDATTTSNFLNGYATVYTVNSSSKLQDVSDGDNHGYATFPYLYVYSEVVDNWAEVLMSTHNEVNPYSYIKDNTSKEDLVEISSTLADKLISRSFKNTSLYSNKEVTIKENINTTKNINETINPGAIVYYEVSGDNTVTAISGNNDYVGVKLYGYKDGIYSVISSSMSEIEEDLTYYVRYDKFYLAIYNADITSSNSYTITMKKSEYLENSDFVTTFNNYNIEVDMDITIAGINTKTVSKGTIDEIHQKEYLDITTTSMGIISLNNKAYSDFNTGYTYMTQPYGGDVWWKEKSASQMVDLGGILEKLISMKDVTKVSDDHYKIKMTSEDITGLMDSGNADTSLITGDVYVEVYTENGYIIKLEYDFTNMISGFDLFTTTIKYSNYDKAGDVEIPQSIIDNAKEQ